MPMKSLSRILTLSSVALLTLSFGCSKQEPSTPPAASQAPSPFDKAAADLKKAADTAQPQAAAVQAAADKTVVDAQAQVAAASATVTNAVPDAQAPATTTVTSQTQSIIDTIKKLLADNKPADALKMIQDLAAAKLTPEQQTTVDALKTQAQALMQNAAKAKITDKAADAVGGLLKK